MNRKTGLYICVDDVMIFLGYGGDVLALLFAWTLFMGFKSPFKVHRHVCISVYMLCVQTVAVQSLR